MGFVFGKLRKAQGTENVGKLMSFHGNVGNLGNPLENTGNLKATVWTPRKHGGMFEETLDD